MAKSGDPEKNKIADAVWNRTSFNAMYIADIVFMGTLEDCAFQKLLIYKSDIPECNA